MKFFCLLIGLFSIFASLLSAQQDYLQFLPKNTIAVIALNDASGLYEKMQEYPVCKFVKDDSVQEFLQRPLQRFQQEVLGPHGLDMETCMEYMGAAQGQMVFALLDIVGKGEKPEDFPLVFMIDAGDRMDKMLTLLDRLREQTEKLGMINVEEEFMDATIVYFKKGEGDDAFDEHREVLCHLCYAIKDNLFIAGLGDAGIKEIITRMSQENTSAGLLENEIYANTLSQCEVAGSDYTIFLNGARIFELIMAQIEPEEVEEVSQVVEILGLDNLQAFAACGNFYDNGKMTGKAFLLAPGKRRGFLKLFQSDTQSALLPMAVPENVASYTAMSMSPEVVWEMIMDIIEILPEKERAKAMAQIQGIEKQLQFSFSDDFFPSLGNEMRIYKDYTRPITEKSERLTATLSLGDAQKFQMCLDKILLLMENDMLFKKSTYMGTVIYTPDERALSPNELQDPPAFCVFNSQFIFSTRRSSVEKAIRLNTKGTGNLLSADSFQAMLPMAPGFKNMLYYSDFSLEIEFLKITFKGLFKKATQDSSFIEESKDWIDWGKFPPAEVFERFFSILEISTMTVQPQGFLIETHVKFPE